MTEIELSRSAAVDALNGFDPQQVIEWVSQAGTADEVNDVRARIAAAKAWAKVHSRIKEVRLDLLRIEIAALKRMGELGVFDGLSGADAQAARWLASASDAEVAEAIDKAGNVTTAASVVRAAKEFAHIRERHDAGYSWATNPPARKEGFAGYTDDELDNASHEVPPITAILNEVIEEYTEALEPFTIEDVADAVLSRSKIPGWSHDAAFMDGIRRACRESVSKAVPKCLGPTPLPRFITCRTEDGAFVRIPAVNAKLPHLDDMIAIREEQLERDRAAIERLQQIRDRLDGMLSGRSRDQTSIGQILVQLGDAA